MFPPPPLSGLKVLELAGLAPAPFAGLLLADSGASVLRIDRPPSSSSSGGAPLPSSDLLTRRKTSIPINLKDPLGISLLLSLCRQADILIDPFRPGVLEKLGLPPSLLLSQNPRLILARMTGFRRDGKYSSMAGHDINYLSVSGSLSLLGRANGPPTPPINILGDFAGGGATLFQGILLALLAREKSGKGQVVEANMVDGASYLATFPRFALGTPTGDQPRGQNILDSGCPYYDTYATKDGRFMAVGALEPQFFRAFIQGVGLPSEWERKRYDRKHWPELRSLLENKFRTRTRDEWEAIFDGTDACCTPVLTYPEMADPTNKREGDQRPPVTLTETPMLAVTKNRSQNQDPSLGQGEGVEGEGYQGQPLLPGQGGEETLKEWLGWVKGEQFDVEDGGLVLNQRPEGGSSAKAKL
ncbi:putative alpha-methylacyl racemase [Podospora australis]|uniref:Alpha-methylacyl racemase n=1 Tax=Podospora australis TaxID=1536484 RepID=A0AAN6X3D1_9PEZI|nr:putative alpha-methylacyl racemase [Podospora australis]